MRLIVTYFQFSGFDLFELASVLGGRQRCLAICFVLFGRLEHLPPAQSVYLGCVRIGLDVRIANVGLRTFVTFGDRHSKFEWRTKDPNLATEPCNRREL